VRRTREFSSEQQQLYKQKLDESEARLESYRRNVLSSSVMTADVNPGNVSRARNVAEPGRVEADDLTQRVATLRSQLGGKVSDQELRSLSTPEVTSLAGQMATLERQLAAATLGEAAGDGSNSLKLSIARKHGELASELALGSVKTLAQLAPDLRDIAIDLRVAQADLGGVVSRRDWLDRQV